MTQHDTTLPLPRMDTSAFSDTPHRRIAVIVGALFVLQIISFAIGASRIETYLAGDGSKSDLVTGVFLQMCSGVAIVVVGLLMYRVLKGGRSSVGEGVPAHAGHIHVTSKRRPEIRRLVYAQPPDAVSHPSSILSIRLDDVGRSGR